jgi:hypothetical protein
MPVIVKKKSSKTKKSVKKRIAKEEKLPYLGNDAFFVKKAEKAKEALVKSGLLKA